jgi:DNA-directed RNA polymerase subunit alpha
LTIEVWTDGSVRPDDAIGLAAKLVKDHMTIFINFEEEQEEYRYEDIARAPLPRNDVLDRSIDELELSCARLQLFEKRRYSLDPRSR